MEKYFHITQNGCNVQCKLYCTKPQDVRRVVLCGHGFGGHKDNKAVQRFADFVLKKHKDVGVLIYDAPCHGDDVKKNWQLSDCLTYIDTVKQYAQKVLKAEELFVYANSFGGYQYLLYLSEYGNPFGKIALRCPAVNMYDVLSQTIMSPSDQKALSRKKPILVGFDRKVRVTQALLDELKATDITVRDYSQFAKDILIMHGTKDEIVPFDVVKDFAEKNDIRFVAVENADHRFIDPKKMDEAIKAITEFFGF